MRNIAKVLFSYELCEYEYGIKKFEVCLGMIYAIVWPKAVGFQTSVSVKLLFFFLHMKGYANFKI